MIFGASKSARIFLSAISLALFSACVSRTFNKSTNKSITEEGWEKPSCFDSNNLLFEPSKTMRVYTYTTESSFQQLIGAKDLKGQLAKLPERAGEFLRKKMENAAQSNLSVKDRSEFGASARMGYGVYVATDPLQSWNYGEFLISFEIPTNAPYIFGSSTTTNLSQIQCPFFGIIYEFSSSASGKMAAALRFDSNVHKAAKPFVEKSVRAYRRNYQFSIENGYEFLDEPLGQFSHGATWEERNVLAKDLNLDPEKVFVERYFDFASFFGQLRAKKEAAGVLNPDLIDKSGSPTSLGLVEALAAEMFSRPKWIVDGIGRLKSAVATNPDVLPYCSRKLRLPNQPDNQFAACVVSFFVNSLRHGVDPNRSTGLELEEAKSFAKMTGLLDSGASPSTYSELSGAVISRWATAAKKDAIRQGVSDYSSAVGIWTTNNLDAFVSRMGLKN